MAKLTPYEEVAQRLKDLGAKPVFMRMARAGQLLDVQCEMPKCFCPRGEHYFDNRDARSPEWKLSVDHYPTLATNGGRLEPWNVRIGHVLCNNVDYGWRSRINALIKKGKSLEEIAETLNRKKIPRPHGTPMWTAAGVRKEFVS